MTTSPQRSEEYLVVMRGWHVATILVKNGSDCRGGSDRCGGCDECLLMQAYHYGLTVRDYKGFWKFYEQAYFHAVEAWYWLKKEWEKTDASDHYDGSARGWEKLLGKGESSKRGGVF